MSERGDRGELTPGGGHYLRMPSPHRVHAADQNWAWGQAIIDRMVVLLAEHRRECGNGPPCCGDGFMRALQATLDFDVAAPYMLLQAALWRLTDDPGEVQAAAARVARRGP
jgi:hypothetical protein